MIVQLLYFLFISLGTGYAAWRLLGLKEDDDYARLFLWVAAGLVVFVQASTLLGFLHLSYWYVYTGLALVLLALALRKGMPHFELPKFDLGWAIVIALFLIHFYVYVTGSLSYPWLEDDDPWSHASAARYVSVEGAYIQPEPRLLHYLAPYPPFFDVLLGTLFGVEGSSLQLTLKFFNALLVSLSIPLFYCWMKRRLDGRPALWATAILTMLPSFMSHFVWSQTLAMLLAFPAFYFIDRYLAERDRQSGAMAALSLAAVMISQPSVAGIIFIMAAIYGVALAIPDAAKKEFGTSKAIVVVLAAALLLSIVEFWGPMFLMYGTQGVLSQMGLNLGFVTGGSSEDTSGGIIYGISDFIVAPSSSKMDQPVGWGLFVTLLLLAGLAIAAYRLKKGEDQAFNLAMVFLLVFCFMGVEGNALPYKMMPHRFWVFLALPVSVLAGIGAAGALGYAERNWKGLAGIVAVVLALGLLLTSAAPKYEVETSMWPPGINWVANEQISGYVHLKEALPANTKLFSFCGLEEHADGMDMAGYAWVKEVADYKTASINDSVAGNYAFLKKYGYAYALIDQSCLASNPPEAIQAKLNALLADERFSLQEQLSGNAFVMFKVQ